VTLQSLDELLKTDLDAICGGLREEFPAMAAKRLLITGGAGFLGYYLVQSVLHWNDHYAGGGGIRLTVVDNYARGVPEWLQRLAGRKHDLALVQHDIVKPLPAALGDFEYIVHAAGIASPIYYRRHPIETMDANINGLRHLLDYASRRRQSGHAFHGFLFFSSSEIYGDPPPDKIPTSEDYRGNVSCTGPRACYDESKRYGETLCVNFARVHGLPAKMARPFNNYGPGLKITDGRVIPDFARSIIAGRDIVMLSDGSPKRTFCYVTDAVTGYYKVLARGQDGEAYNVGVEKPEISMLELARQLAAIGKRLFGYEGKVIHQASADKDYLVDNPNRRCPVIEKARSHLGYRPAVPLEEGLRRSLTWYHYHPQAENL
jgi:nucleoside-diphosphate-sugar epimerase